MSRIWFSMVIFLFIASTIGHAGDINDLWTLISSYEDVGITEKDLALFLQSHGYDATVGSSSVVVNLGETKAYLTPNGAAQGLADMWKNPPQANPTPYLIIPPDAIQRNAKLKKSGNSEYINELSKIAVFPVKPLGMCFDGAKQLGTLYEKSGYKLRYMYDPQGVDSQGHIWVAVMDRKQNDSWLAVDSYYGVIKDNDDYYKADYSLSDFDYLNLVNPQWKIG